jgi:hypothetical protein
LEIRRVNPPAAPLIAVAGSVRAQRDFTPAVYLCAFPPTLRRPDDESIRIRPVQEQGKKPTLIWRKKGSAIRISRWKNQRLAPAAFLSGEFSPPSRRKKAVLPLTPNFAFLTVPPQNQSCAFGNLPAGCMRKEAFMKLALVQNALRLAVAIGLVCAAAFIHSQNTTSCAIAGTVTDASGAVVPAVQVTVTNQATGVAKVVTTDNSGYFIADTLLPGDYSVSSRKSGFKTQLLKDIHLDPGQRRGENMKLEVGEVASTVTVEADAVAVQTESAELGGTVSSKEVSNLMLNGRNFQTLALIVPGVSAASGANALPNYGEGGYLGQTEIVVGGTSIEKTTYSIDGLFDMDPNALINVNVLPTIDSIDEFRILKDNFSARYGMAGAGQILVETKSGGSQFHGSGYEYVRNSYIGTAKPYTTPPTQGIAALHYNIFGYTLGGPIVIPGL